MSSSLQFVPPSAPSSAASKPLLEPQGWLGAVDDPPPAKPTQIWQAAIAAEARSVECRLDDVWQDHARGRLSARWESIGPDRVLLVARVGGGEPGLDADETKIVARVFAGDQQKGVASDLGLTPSTISGRYIRAIDKLDLAPQSVPLPLILAAQAWVGIGHAPAARNAFFTVEGQVCMVVSVPRPDTSYMVDLTAAEQEVARYIIEGCSRFEIAHQRRTSIHTVARQLHAIHGAFRSTGRYALIRNAVELGCFR